jgi:hypothetical protein
MKKNKKTERSPKLWPKRNKETISLSNTTKNITSNPNNVTSKAEEKAKSSNVSLYDACDITPLSVYIDLVCDNRLERLIISGNPSQELLEETKMKLTAEFSELSGGGEMQMFIETTRQFFYQRNLIAGMQIAMQLIAAGNYDESIAYLNKSGITCTAPQNDEQTNALLKQLSLKLKNLSSKFKQIKKRYESLQKRGEKPTRKYYNRLLVALSTCEVIKMQLDRNKLTLSEFAEYINIFNEYHNHLKTIKHGKH